MSLYTAMITPFHEDGSLDLDGFRKNLDHQVNSGVDGVVVLGTTGESPTLVAEERDALIRTAAEQKSVQVIVGTGANSTQTAIAQAMRAQELGADQLLVISPYYNKPTQRGIYEHFEALTRAVSIPIIVYNHPGRTGVDIEVLTMREISLLPGIAGVKEASGCMSRISEIIAHTPENFACYSGNDELTLPTLAVGGDGVISVLSNLAPGPMGEMVRAEDWNAARRIHYDLLPLFKGLCFETNPIPVKEAMRFLGRPAGPCRLPLTDMQPTLREALHRLLKDSELVL